MIFFYFILKYILLIYIIYIKIELEVFFLKKKSFWERGRGGEGRGRDGWKRIIFF